MQTLSQKMNKHLVNLAWSLWTELGVAGVKRSHQKFLVQLEELILFTAEIANEDPRLRDEVLDWCAVYHSYVSTSRLRNLALGFGKEVCDSFSMLAASINSNSQAKWPVFKTVKKLKYKPSGKSKLPSLKLPALLCFRLRALFSVGARADVIAFLLSKKKLPHLMSISVIPKEISLMYWKVLLKLEFVKHFKTATNVFFVFQNMIK